MDDSLKTNGINNQMLRLGCCLPAPYQNLLLRAWLTTGLAEQLTNKVFRQPLVMHIFQITSIC